MFTLDATTTHAPLAVQLEYCKRERFSGLLRIQGEGPVEGKLYFYLGRVIFATGGRHPYRRWHRLLQRYAPQVNAQEMMGLSILAGDKDLAHTQYEQLNRLFQKGDLTREQAMGVVTGLLEELFFDLLQSGELRYETEAVDSWWAQNPLTLVNLTTALEQAEHSWQNWRVLGLSQLHADHAPVLKNPSQLESQVSPQVYESLSRLLDGQRTLRDLAVEVRLDINTLVRSFLPYIQQGIVQLIEVPPLWLAQAASAPLVACIDDSLQICQTMEMILTKAGYRCLPIQDPIRGFSTLLQQKPDLIFLDLVMPNTNGYEVCAKLRKTTALRHVPVIILTGNLIDWVKAKFVGSTSTMGKPINPNVVVAMAEKHLRLAA